MDSRADLCDIEVTTNHLIIFKSWAINRLSGAGGPSGLRNDGVEFHPLSFGNISLA